MARIDSAYDYYISTYRNQQVSRYDAHKKSDLRKVYNSIVKSNTESPLYKISNLDEAKRYAIDIKENAKTIQNVVASLSDNYGGFKDSFRKRVAVSSNEESVDVEYIGDGSNQEETTSFSIKVLELAKPQINQGNFLKNEALSFTPGTYAFDLSTNMSTYEFQFTVGPGETNLDILKKLDHLVNTSNLGVTSSILEGEHGTSALALTSVQTGLSEQENHLFAILPTASADSLRAMNLLGLSNISQQASNSSFLLNGNEKFSLSNTFTINKIFNVTLKEAGEETEIGFKNDVESIAHNIETLTDAFNNILTTTKNFTGNGTLNNSKLFNDISSVSKRFREELTSLGISVDSEGFLQIEKDVLLSNLENTPLEQSLKTLSQFKDSLGNKANAISVNPMNYVNKVVVAYKNPGHNFATPYITSIYSGLMLDSSI